MNKSALLISGLLAALGATSSAWAAPQGVRVEYKCYFELFGGSNTIRYLTGHTDKIDVFKSTLPGFLYAKDGKTRLKVRRVIECVKADETFSALSAKELDKKTLN